MGDKGRIEIPDEKTEMEFSSGLALDEEETDARPRAETEFEKPVERVRDFREVEKGFLEDQALKEATRCLRCDLEKERSS
jgi:NADH-quinone oxidoreductase subunit F